MLTISQAAQQTGIHRRKLLRAITAGDLKATKAGTATAVWLIDPADLDRYTGATLHVDRANIRKWLNK
jgi:excisionase family DNA binding protein